ncbi:MAG: hypothetical protein WDA35_03255 [Bacilli bacterium]
MVPDELLALELDDSLDELDISLDELNVSSLEEGLCVTHADKVNKVSRATLIGTNLFFINKPLSQYENYILC